MRLLLAGLFAHLVSGAIHVNRSIEAASVYGDIGLTPDGHMYVKGEYIVKFKRGLATAQLQDHMSYIPKESILQDYPHGFGYAAKLDQELLAKVKGSSEVAYVELNHIAWATVEDNTCAPEIEMVPGVWGTIRTNNRPLVISGPYYEERRQGLDVHSYVIDTGVDISHPAFGGRALHGIDYTGEGHGDGNGHGTHVAGTMIGDGYGICPEGYTTAVKVLNSAGSGTFANVIAGILWTADDAASDRKGKGVANLSLGGGYNQAVSDAIEDVFNRGIICTVAAGNSNNDACTSSPAAAAHSVCVGATATTDARASFSSFGCCVDIYAPGQGILSTTPNGGTATYSGTSMAAPHMAGIIQAFWSVWPNEPTSSIKADIISAGTGRFPDTTPPLTGGVFSGTCAASHANCRRVGAACEAPASAWNNNNLGYQRCVNA